MHNAHGKQPYRKFIILMHSNAGYSTFLWNFLVTANIWLYLWYSYWNLIRRTYQV